MNDQRAGNIRWRVADDTGRLLEITGGAAHLAVLMDIRDELQKLNALLACSNFIRIPDSLRTIARNTTKKPRAKA